MHIALSFNLKGDATGPFEEPAEPPSEPPDSPTTAELLFGIAAMPSGPRRKKLTENLDAQLAMYEGRILAFDADAAHHYARLAAMVRKVGRGLPLPDGYIAAIAAAHGFAVASRDTAPFRAAGLRVIDPWSA